MIRVVVLYEQEPDAESYVEHAELCRQVPGGTFRHGRVFGSPTGEPHHRYFAEWEFADRDAFRLAAESEEFAAAGRDTHRRGFAHPAVEFVELG